MGAPQPEAIGLEIVVADLDRAIELFRDVLGCPVIARQPSTLVVGEMALVDAGSIVISLLQPAEAGDGPILGHRDPRVTQLMLRAPAVATQAALDRSVEAGLSVVPSASGFHIDPDALTGALGATFAIVVTAIDDAAGES